MALKSIFLDSRKIGSWIWNSFNPGQDGAIKISQIGPAVLDEIGHKPTRKHRVAI